MTDKTFCSHIHAMIREYSLRTGANCTDEITNHAAQWADVGKLLSHGGPATTVDCKHWAFCSSAAFLLYYADVRKVRRYEALFGMMQAYDQCAGGHNANSVIENPENWIDAASAPFYASAAALLFSARADIDNLLSGSNGRKTQFQGFCSVSDFERECSRIGYRTKRVPFYRQGSTETFFALITDGPTATSIKSWNLLTGDETAHILSGVMMKSLLFPEADIDYTGKLAIYGFFPDAPAPIAPEYPTADDGQICFPL